MCVLASDAYQETRRGNEQKTLKISTMGQICILRVAFMPVYVCVWERWVSIDTARKTARNTKRLYDGTDLYIAFVGFAFMYVCVHTCV